jgi:bilin biosynthesis protein
MALEKLGDTSGYAQAAQDSDWVIAAKASTTLKHQEKTA